MGIGDLFEVPVGTVDDIFYVDAGIYDTEEYGAVYLVDAERPALIDTGIGTNWKAILRAIEGAGVDRDELSVIAPTHVHLDHAGGTGYFAEACENADVVTHERGIPHLVDPERLWRGTKKAVGDRIRFYGEPQPVPADRARGVTDGDTIDLGDRLLHVRHTPGHAPHQIVFHEPASDVLFTADAAGIYVPAIDRILPTTPPPNFDFEQAIDDINVLQEIDPFVLCFAHYGPTVADDYLHAASASLTDWVQAVSEARERFQSDDAVVQAVTSRNELGEVWGESLARSVTEMDVRGVLTYLDRREPTAGRGSTE